MGAAAALHAKIERHRAQLRQVIREALDADATYQALADAMGVTRQAIHQMAGPKSDR